MPEAAALALPLLALAPRGQYVVAKPTKWRVWVGAWATQIAPGRPQRVGSDG